MIVYASRTGTRRNLVLMRALGWRILVSRAGPWRTEGFPYALDNGAWTDFQAGTAFDEEAFDLLVAQLGRGADFIVLPDIVAGGRPSLDLSMRWSNRCRAECNLVLIAVQDGMEPADLVGIVGREVGIFLGGSTAWKLARMVEWGRFAHEQGCYFHVARANTRNRINLAAAAGAHSFDGSSGSRYAVSIPLIDNWRSQPDMLAPVRLPSNSVR